MTDDREHGAHPPAPGSQARDEQDDDAARTSLTESNPSLDDEDQPGRAGVTRDASEPSTTGTVGQSSYPRDTESG